jgi:hypothetical protein
MPTVAHMLRKKDSRIRRHNRQPAYLFSEFFIFCQLKLNAILNLGLFRYLLWCQRAARLSKLNYIFRSDR